MALHYKSYSRSLLYANMVKKVTVIFKWATIEGLLASIYLYIHCKRIEGMVGDV